MGTGCAAMCFHDCISRRSNPRSPN
jgi:hypothetical protein